MNDGKYDGSTRRPRWQPTLAAIVATAGLVASGVAIGAGAGSARAQGASNARESPHSQLTNVRKALAYSRCMRSHGVPNFPDPNSSGAIPKVSPQELNNPQFKRAEQDCQNLLPPGTDDMYPPGEVQQLLVGMVRFSKCMRAHGVPNWPDPTTDAEGRPEFPLEEVPGTSYRYWHQPWINHVGGECQHLLPQALGGTPIG